MTDAPAPPRAPAKTPPKAPAIVAAAILVGTTVLTIPSEGYRAKPYRDPASNLTVCYGDTANIDPARVYSKDQCATRLRARMAKDFAPVLEKCLPQLIDPKRVNVFAAMLDVAYNAGPERICKSRMAVQIRAGHWTASCNGFYGFFTTALNRKTGKRIPLPGLVTRRAREAALCLKPVS